MNPRYRLTGQLETGELAELYAGTRNDYPVEIKLFHPQTSDVRYAQELADTARLLNTVQAPGIARFVEIGLVKGRLAVVREHADGLTLGAALQRLATRDVVLPAPVALALVIELLETVEQAHAAGVIHGAITPGNVTLTPDGHAVIGDFGALRALQAVPALKKVFSARGRNTYRAPELAQGEPPSELSDIYSLGALGYELLTLREPVVPGSAGNVSTRREALPPPSRVDRRLNSRIDPILMRAIDPEPTRRFRSCIELSVALRNFLASTGGMPPSEYIQQVIQTLSPRNPELGPVPFSEPFMLSEVDGADLPPITERSRVIDMRPAFSADPPAPEDAKTEEAAPMFEEYKAEEWEAPPGLQSPRPRRAMSMSGQPAAGARPSGRNPRLKVMGDYSTVEPTPGPSPEEIVTDPGEPTEDRPEPPARTSAPKPSLPQVPTPSPESPPPEEPPVDVSGPRPAQDQDLDLSTPAPPPAPSAEELERARRVLRSRRLLLLALFLAAIVASSFGFAIWRLETSPTRAQVAPTPPPRDVGARASGDALDHAASLETQTPQPASPSRPQSRLAAVEPDDASEESSHRRDTAFLTVLSDVPASVSIDGTKVRKRTPLFRYPVQPGNRKIVIEALSTGERHEFELGFEKGKLRRVDEKFKRFAR